MQVNELFDLSNKTAIVTGRGKGLGEIMAHTLAKAGANVVVCSRDLKACDEVSDALVKKGVYSLAYKCDVTVPEEVEYVVSETVKHFGTIQSPSISTSKKL